MGLPFDAVSEPQAEAIVRAAAAGGRRCFISTPNLNFAAACLDDAEFRESVIRSDLSVADGMPIVGLSRLLRAPLPERVAGSGLFERLMRNTQQPPLTVFFFGGEDGVAARAQEVLARERAGVQCVGFDAPGFGSVDDMSQPAVIDRINASGAQFLVVAIGARKGQAWLLRNLDRLQAPVLAYLGAVLNFVAGSVRRAPPWMQRVHLEWLWRVLQEPALARRYWNDGTTLLRVLLRHVLPTAWRLRMHAPSAALLAAARLEIIDDGGAVRRLRLTGAWTGDNLQPLRDALAGCARDGTAPAIDLSRAVYVDSAAAGVLVLASALRTAPVVAASPEVQRLLRGMGAGYLLADPARTP